MKAKIFHILGVIGFIVAMGSLSACFEEDYPNYPGYAYGSPAYAYPAYRPRYYPEYVPTPRYYASSPQRNWRDRERLEHREHKEHGQHEHHEHDRF